MEATTPESAVYTLVHVLWGIAAVLALYLFWLFAADALRGPNACEKMGGEVRKVTVYQTLSDTETVESRREVCFDQDGQVLRIEK